VTKIVPMNSCHANQIALMHLSYLRTRFYGRLGRELLKMYYVSLSDKYGGCGFTAINGTSILGYVCGVWDTVKIKRHFIQRFGLKAVAFTALQLVINPKTTTKLASRFTCNKICEVAVEAGYELRPIVVVPAARGTGLASILVNNLLADAAGRGYSHIHLITEKDNLAANTFYQKHGFELFSQVDRAGNLYNIYHQSTSGKNTQ